MIVFDEKFIFNYITRDTHKELNFVLNDDLNFLYDYNEVQELYIDSQDNDVYIAGSANLHKTDMLRLIVKDLLAGGLNESNVIFIDFIIPFIRDLGILKIISHFTETFNNKPFYVIINEITLCNDWAESISKVKMQFPFVRFLSSSSISPAIHEYFYDHPDSKSKIIVLSRKNDSNTKYNQKLFGVFNEFKYNIKNGICEIKGLSKSGKQRNFHVIPDTIEGYPVKIIASGAFHHRIELTEVVLPDSIEYIGDYAFTYCKNLDSIKFPEKLIHIGDCAFLGASGLKNITGGINIKHIGNSAFYGTSWLIENKNDYVIIGKTLYKYNKEEKKVKLPNNISIIGFYAFANSNIEEIDLSGIDNIKEGAFFNCKKLTVIKNYKIDHVNAFQFYNCIQLKTFLFKLKNIGKFAFKDCTSLENVNLSKAILADGAFENCNGIEDIKDSELSVVGDCAFFNTNLKSADLNNTKSIGIFTFYNSKLQTLSLNSAVEIKDYSFADNRQIKKIYINPSANIGYSIFANCSELKTAELGGKYVLNSYFGDISPVEKLYVIGDCIDNFCRGNNQLREVDISGNSIGNWAFYACSSLKSVKLNVKILGAWCFAYCDGIESIILPESTEYISMNSFRYCHNLEKITIQTSKPLHFGANAFYSTSENKRFFATNKKAYESILIWKEYINSIEEIK